MHAPPLLRHPIVLEGSLHETIWGGRRLSDVAGKALPDGGRIGESWETATDSVAQNAPFAGETLGALVNRYGVGLLGTRAVEIFGPRFPLLAKFIDAQQWLSVQVHPGDRYAAAHEGGKLGKTETWLILDAQPDAQLVYGLKRPATRDEVRAAIAETRLEELLHTMPARAGDVIFVPAGTVHAIGAGVCLYELQEYSDVTYRLYDYGRLQADGSPRELHVEKALDVMSYSTPTHVAVTPQECPLQPGLRQRRVMVACDYFVLEDLRIVGEHTATVAPSSCQIISVLDGACTLRSEGSEVSLRRGTTAVLPAVMGAYTVCSSNARLARSYVPSADDALLRRWTAAQPREP